MLGKTYLHSRYSAKKYFSDKKVIALCNSARKGDIKKMDKILQTGVDINAVGKTGLNPLYWLFVMNPDSKKKRIGFKHLLEKGADPTQIHTKTKMNLIHITSRYKDFWYLKTILEFGHLKPGDLDIEIEGDGWPLALMQASLADRFENFKLLLDYGASINRWMDVAGRTVLTSVCGGGDWKYAYELLKRGADYTIKSKNEKEPYIFRAIAGPRYWPSVATSYHGVDYRQKCVQFLREKGVEVHPWMPEDEKYVAENGEDVLYIKENGQWVKYTESEKYKKEKQERENEPWFQNWIYEKFYK